MPDAHDDERLASIHERAMRIRPDEILRGALTQVLIADLTRAHGWREGISYRIGFSAVPDLDAGEQLVQRGVLTREGSLGRLHLSAAAVERALHVAVNAAIADLLANDPPPATFAAELAEYEACVDEDVNFLRLGGIDYDTADVGTWGA